MTRWFYTDPLAAAWMAKHFGMKLLADTDDGIRVDAGARFIDCDDTFRELWQHDFSYLGKLYVHPESLHLLEMQAGDVIKNPFNGRAWELLDVAYSSGSPIDECPIIQRNGVPFMWPESEGA